MLVATTWKSRPLSPEQAGRMMSAWGKIEEAFGADTASERLCWYIAADGASGLTVSKVNDVDAAVALELETSLALSEFLELTSKIVLDMDSAMPAIMKGMDRIGG
jgi:hypothetical protein